MDAEQFCIDYVLEKVTSLKNHGNSWYVPQISGVYHLHFCTMEIHGSEDDLTSVQKHRNQFSAYQWKTQASDQSPDTQSQSLKLYLYDRKELMMFSHESYHKKSATEHFDLLQVFFKTPPKKITAWFLKNLDSSSVSHPCLGYRRNF